MKNNKNPVLPGHVIAALKDEALAGDIRALKLLRMAAVRDKSCRKFIQKFDGMVKTRKAAQPCSVNYADLDGSWPIS
jgi:hypothetical protein